MGSATLNTVFAVKENTTLAVLSTDHSKELYKSQPSFSAHLCGVVVNMPSYKSVGLDLLLAPSATSCLSLPS